jgi:hypothetical protein
VDVVEHEVVEHASAAEFWAAAEPLLGRDPVRNTVLLTVTHQLRTTTTPATTPEQPPILLSVRVGEEITGVALCTPPHPMVVTALPAECAPAVVAHLLAAGHRPSGVTGAQPEVDAMAAAWSAATGDAIELTMAERLFRLAELVPPTGVPGVAGPVTEAELPLLADWTRQFHTEVGFGDRPSPDVDGLRRVLAGGAARLIHRVDGEPVAFAGASAVRLGTSRIGGVYTPPGHQPHLPRARLPAGE